MAAARGESSLVLRAIGGSALVKLVSTIPFCGVVLTAAAQAQDVQALLEKYRCNICHATNEAKTGPAYIDVAQKYHGDNKALATLTAEIRSGTHGAGPWHMPPHPEMSAADARAIVRYILALKK